MTSPYLKRFIQNPWTFSNFAMAELMQRLYYQPIRHSYSQRQEDVLIEKLLGYKSEGFYVDVGAYDPIRFSNTKRFYDKGWHGINVEPQIHRYQRFLRERPRDINIHGAISSSRGELRLYRFSPETLSTLSAEEAREYQSQGYPLISSDPVPTYPLSEILATHGINHIDFLSVDTEGHDYEVLQSIKWDVLRPTIICVESTRHGSKSENENVDRFLLDMRYHRVFDTGINALYKQG